MPLTNPTGLLNNLGRGETEREGTAQMQSQLLLQHSWEALKEALGFPF